MHILIRQLTTGQVEDILIRISGGLLANFGFAKHEVMTALSELARRKVKNMLQEGKLQDHIFSDYDLSVTDLSGFEAYKALRDSI
jgi:hypothetical protein